MHGWRINAVHIPEGEYVGRLSQRVSPSTPEKIKKGIHAAPIKGSV